jgi:very-short-patch-repair endonuclease
MKERARSLRQDMTDAENRMWYFLRSYLSKQGYNVLHIWNNEVFNNIDGVLATILILLENRATL